MRVALFLAVSTAMIVVTFQQASAVVRQESVGSRFVKEHPTDFKIKSQVADDGLIHFTITRPLPEPRYLVASFTVRDDSSVIARMHFPAFERDGQATYQVVISPKHLRHTRFELAERSFSENSAGKAVPLPGGTDYEIQLAEFIPKE